MTIALVGVFTMIVKPIAADGSFAALVGMYHVTITMSCYTPSVKAS